VAHAPPPAAAAAAANSNLCHIMSQTDRLSASASRCAGRKRWQKTPSLPREPERAAWTAMDGPREQHTCMVFIGQRES
jgi:hypothetical protein